MFRLTHLAAAGSAAALALLALPGLALADTTAPSPPGTSVGVVPIDATVGATGGLTKAVAYDANVTPPAGAVQGCLDAGNVWIIAVTDAGKALANQCVGQPSTGTDAIMDAGMAIGRDSSGYMCSLGGYPNPCPAVFDGKFWQYYNGTPEGGWSFYQVGSDQAQPKGGTIEGWCYGEQCEPPGIALLLTGQNTATSSAAAATTPQPSSTPWGLIGVAAVVVVALAVVLGLRFMRGQPRGAHEA